MQKVCEVCASRYEAHRQTARYCSGRCRKRAQRSGLAQPTPERASSSTPTVRPTPPAAPRAGALTAAALAELQAAGRENTALGLAWLVIAERMDQSIHETGSALAAVSRDFRAARAAALEESQSTGDALDEMAKKRAERLARAGQGG